MRIVRIVQVVTLVVLGVYGVIVHNANPDPLALPGLVPLSPALVVLAAAVVAFLVGWLPTRLRVWRRSREVTRLERRIAELEQHVPNYDRTPATAVIPDRDALGDEEDRSLEDVHR